jgi:2',3'-cyclic-nucleotide 2'-phosphodiesterase (5'-nucleotidase family)
VDTIYINSGLTLFPGSAFMDYEAESLKTGAAIMTDAMAAMNIDAYTPGVSDLKMGSDVFKTTTKKLPVLITNSNSKDFLKEIKIKRAGINIKIFGVTTEAKGLSTYDPVKALKKYTAKKSKNELFVLLADTDKKTLTTILKNIRNIDVVLSSSIEEQLTKPLKIGNTLVIRVLKGGDSIGLLKKENEVVFLGHAYSKDNEFTDRIKKYEGLQQAAAPKVKDDF